MGSRSRRRRRNAARAAAGYWYLVITICSFGLLTAVPFFHAAQVLRDVVIRRLAWIYTAVTAIVFVGVGSLPVEGPGQVVSTADRVAQSVLTLLWLGMIVSGGVLQNGLRKRVYGPLPAGVDAVPPPPLPYPAPPTTAFPPVAPMPPYPAPPVDPAIAAVLAARGRRTEARALAVRDPLMARELRIGRPDLDSQYDDGGLVDLNSAPAEVIARVCEIDTASAQRIVDAREHQGGPFANIDEVFVIAELPYPVWDRIHDRAILI